MVDSDIVEMRDDLLMHLENNMDASRFVLDVSDIEAVGPLGVNLLIGLFKELTANLKTFEVIEASENFMKAANFFKFTKLFNVKEAGE